MSRITGILGEIHRRSVWQVLGSYVVGAWIVLQFAETLSGLIGLPLWFGPAIILLVLLGFPLIVVTSVVQGGRRPAAGEDAGPSGAGGTAPTEAGDVSDTAGSGEPRSPSDAAPPVGDGWARSLFTWRNAAIAGGTALVLLGAGTVGWSGLRAAGIGPMGTLMAKGVLDTQERLVLADFDDRTDDRALGETVTALFRIDLSQSPTVTLLEPAQLEPALSRMQRDAAEPFTADVALELARREGIKAVLTGEVLPLGSGVVLSVRLMAAAGGETLTAMREDCSAT